MKYISILVLVAIFGWGGKIQVLKSTSQDWLGGLRESGYGTDYRITVKVKAGSDQLQFEDLWVGNLHMKVRTMTDPANPKEKSFSKGSQVTLKAGIIFRPGPDEKMALLGADSIPKPFNFKGGGLLGYSWKGKKTYLVITEFSELERIIYP
jgi:hypothetical protein